MLFIQARPVKNSVKDTRLSSDDAMKLFVDTYEIFRMIFLINPKP